MRLVGISVLVLVISGLGAPTIAQTEQLVGCDLDALSVLLLSASSTLQDIKDEEAVVLLSDLGATIETAKLSCSLKTIDYSAIPQSRTVDGGFVLGDPDAPLTIVEFSDFLCGHCQQYEAVVSQFIEEFVVTGEAKFEYRMFPVIDPEASPFVAQLAECADTLRPGSFWEAHDVLFALIIDQGLTQSSVDMYVDRMELNLDDLVACFEGANQIAVDSEFGSDLGVTGTPAVMVRYGDGEPEWIVVDDQTFDRGGVDFEILAAVVENASKSK